MNYDNYNLSVQRWGGSSLTGIKATGRAYNIKHRANSPSSSDSLSKMTDKYREKQGAIKVVVFTFNRELIYTMMGAGKGRGGLKGSRWINAQGVAKRTNPASLNKMGTGGRTQKPFIDAWLDGPAGVEQLGDIVAGELGDAVVGGIRFK